MRAVPLLVRNGHLTVCCRSGLVDVGSARTARKSSNLARLQNLRKRGRLSPQNPQPVIPKSQTPNPKPDDVLVHSAVALSCSDSEIAPSNPKP